MRNLLLTICISFGCLAVAEPKRIYLACDDHSDYMWTADEKTYQQAFLRMIDYYLDLADKTQSNPSDFQSRFACDGSYWLWVYEHERSQDEFARLMARIQSGHISVPMTAIVNCFGGMPTEAVLRSMYYAGSLERRFGVRFRLAMSMENQTQPWGLASLWAGSGAKYSWKGICACASRVPDAGNRDHEIYWYTGPDEQKILMKWNSLFGDNQSIGGYAEARNPKKVVDFVTSNASFLKKYPYPVIGCFGKGWDDLETRTDEFITAAQQLSNADRRVIVSNELDFFEDFEKNYGVDLPSENYSYGNEWELLIASMSELSASVRRSVEKLRTAEALATLVSLHQSDFMKPWEAKRDQAFVDLGLYFDHDWTADGPVSRPKRTEWQRQIAQSINSYVDELYTAASDKLGTLIPTAGTNPRFYVFNPLGWKRTDYADLPYSSNEPVQVVDLDRKTEAPSQFITRQNQLFLRIWAQDIPPVGYKVYEIRPGVGKTFENTIVYQDKELENLCYRIRVNPGGAIVSLIDKMQGNREFAQEVNGRYINDIGSTTGTLEIENQGPVSATLKMVSDSPIKKTTSLTLYRDSDRIDIVNEITQNFNEILSYAFGFDLEAPAVHHEEVGAIALAKLRSEGGDYATRCARYDWLTFNHFADMTGSDKVGVTLSNADSFFFRLGNSTVKKLDTATPILYALIGGQVDGKQLGIERQGGDAYFCHHFALRTHAEYEPTAAMKFSLEHQNPLICKPITGTQAELPETNYSLITIDNLMDHIVLWALKPAEAGIDKGIIVRLWNAAETKQSAAIQLSPYSLANAKRVTHLETEEETIPIIHAVRINADFNRQQLRTFLLEPKGIKPSAASSMLK